MNKIAVSALKPGDVFTEPVFIEGENVLVPAGIPVRQKDIDQVKAWGIDTVETEGVIQDKTAENAPAGKPGPVLSITEAHENKGPYRTYVNLIERLDTAFASIASETIIGSSAIDFVVSQLLQELKEPQNHFVGYVLGGEVTGRELAKSSINTAILSALVAQELKLVSHKILQITTGALLHDVGMLRMPKEILEKRGGLMEAERQQVRSHPLHGYKIVTKEFSCSEEVGAIVLQHHERWDGAGYPRRTAGKEISLGARIVSVADAFEAMVSNKPYRNSMAGYQAMKNLMADNARHFDSVVLKAFIKAMGIYPIGSIVLLNNNTFARVLDVHPDAPLRPKIRILTNESGKNFKADEGGIIDLLAERSLFISKAVDPQDLVKKNG